MANALDTLHFDMRQLLWTEHNRLPTPGPRSDRSSSALSSRDPSPHRSHLLSSSLPHSISPDNHYHHQPAGLHSPQSPHPPATDSAASSPSATDSVSGGDRTFAFFGSSFAIPTPDPPPPPQRAQTVSHRRPKTESHDGPNTAQSSTGDGGVTHPRSTSESSSRSSSGGPLRSQTANASFFAQLSTPTPAPPPSLVESGAAKPLPPRARLAPLRSPSPTAPRHRTGRSRDFADITDEVLVSSPISVNINTTDLGRAQPLDKHPYAHLPSPVSPSSNGQSTPQPPSRPSPPLAISIPRTTIMPPPVAGSERCEPHAGEIIGDAETHLKLVRILGKGAFSSVWLATDEDEKGISYTRPLERRQCQNAARKKRDRKVDGLKPKILSPGVTRSSFATEASPIGDDEDSGKGRDHGRVVAVKMMDKVVCDMNDRTRISFVREVEVLRHISHPSIVSYLHSFTTPTHHCLVLEALHGGELFDFINSDQKYGQMTTPLLRRMWVELSGAARWMHSVALVHRDIKLENILLTRDPFDPSSLSDSSPLLKLTDFGLARFIDPANPLLTTRCGSELYAAPEIIIGSKYDGRQTDAWACGVVLYTLATRVLPFDPETIGTGSQRGRNGRRACLARIARAEYTWPEGSTSPGSPVDEEHVLASEGLKKVVGRLLVRDPAKRARLADLWDEEWMQVPLHPQSTDVSATPLTPVMSSSSSSSSSSSGRSDLLDQDVSEQEDDEFAGRFSHPDHALAEGYLLDESGISIIARQEELEYKPESHSQAGLKPLSQAERDFDSPTTAKPYRSLFSIF